MMVVNALESCFSALVLEHFHFHLWDLADALIQSALQKSFYSPHASSLGQELRVPSV